MNELVLTPENERLRNLKESYKSVIARLLTQKEQLLSVEEPNLNAAYLTSIGSLQYDLFVIKTDIAKLKLETNLIRGYINQNKAIEFKQIEKELKSATTAYQKELEAKAEELKRAREWMNLSPLSDFENAELKRLYHLIVKQLHPDLHPDLSENERTLFFKAQRCYKLGDLEGMRMAFAQLDQHEISSSCFENLADEVHYLKKTMDKLSQEIEHINQRFPFTQREFLKNSTAIAEKQAELKAAIEQAGKERNEYQQYVNALKLWKPGLLN